MEVIAQFYENKHYCGFIEIPSISKALMLVYESAKTNSYVKKSTITHISLGDYSIVTIRHISIEQFEEIFGENLDANVFVNQAFTKLY